MIPDAMCPHARPVHHGARLFQLVDQPCQFFGDNVTLTMRDPRNAISSRS